MKENNLQIVDSFNDSKYYINRELSWMDFNKRVLVQALEEDTPMMEKLNFLSISSTNLDEFISVRFASIIDKLRNRKSKPDISGLVPIKEYIEVNKAIKEFKITQETVFAKLKLMLAEHEIEFVACSSLSKPERKKVNQYFEREVFPLLSPMSYDTTSQFPFLRSKKLNICVFLENDNNTKSKVISIIPLDSVNRFYVLQSKKGMKILLVEDIILSHLDRIFTKKKVEGSGLVRIIRDADQRVSTDENIYLIDRMRETLKDRRHSSPIFMEISNSYSKEYTDLLENLFGVSKKNVFRGKMLEFGSLRELCNLLPEHQYAEFNPKVPRTLVGEYDIFTAVDGKSDFILMHPYQSYNSVVKFIEHASVDDKVESIRITLYRVSSIESPIVESLCKAAERGKHVSVLLEIKARFDEERNIDLSDKLRTAGCRVTVGLEHTKVHAKFCVVVRRSESGMQVYSHVGTGNYNEKTAKIYSDFSYFTRSEKIGYDLINIFNSLTGYSEPLKNLTTLAMAPYNLRETLEDRIDDEIKSASEGKKAAIIIVVNSLSDKKIIRKLYKASECGVKVTIICRGVCSMKPINDNIHIKSIVGRFLEHSRVYFFHSRGKKFVYIASADLLKRNLSKRVELLIPIKSDRAKNKILHVLSAYLRDTVNSFTMTAEGKYKSLNITGNTKFDAHQMLIQEAKKDFSVRKVKCSEADNEEE